MPYKDKEKQKEAMRGIMRKQREKKKRQKKKARQELLQLITENPETEQKIPSLLELVFGKRKKKREGLGNG